MLRFLGFCLLITFFSCKQKQVENPTTKTEPAVEEKSLALFGFDLDNYLVQNDTVKAGDSFGEIMLKNHVDYLKIDKVSKDCKDTFDVRKIKVGKPYTILKAKDSLQKAEVFIYENDKINYTVVDLRDSVKAYTGKKPVKLVEREVSGVINSSLSQTLDSLGVDYAVTINLSEVYAWSIDFFRLERGDTFKIIFDEKYINDTIYAGSTEIKSAFFKHKGKEVYAFPYVTDSEKNIMDYYDDQAQNLRSTFLKAPIKFGYRISSRYNLRRRIAYYGYKVRPHKGTDYAAPIGTPIIATADGTVTESRRRGGNGKYVKIKHNGTYSTQYLHMKAQKVKKGEYVRQGDVIGWVGMTGNTGGPHVCYRFWKNGVQVDPLREKLPSAEPIPKSERANYNEYIAPLKYRLDCLEPTKVDNEFEPLNIPDQNAITKN